jgi:hypothetical protein
LATCYNARFILLNSFAFVMISYAFVTMKSTNFGLLLGCPQKPDRPANLTGALAC